MPSPYILNRNRDSIQENPEIAVLRSGRVVAVWEDLALDPGFGGTFGVYGAILSADLTRYHETSFRVPQGTRRLQLDPQVAALENGGFAVGWHSDGRGARSGVADPWFDGCLRFFDADGRPRTGEIQLTPQIRQDQFIQDVATLSDGSVVAVVARQLYGAVYDLVAYRYRADGERIGVETLAREVDMLTNSFGGQARPGAQIAVKDRGYAVAWFAHEDRVPGADGHRIYTRLFENDGDARGRARIVSEDNRQQLDQEGPRIIAIAGGFAVAWDREMSDSDFDRPGEQTLADIVDIGGGLTLVTYESQVGPSYDDTQTLEGRVFGANGRPLTDPFRISELVFEGLESGNSVLTRHGLASVFAADTEMFEDIVGSTATPRLTLSGGGRDDRIGGSVLRDRLLGRGGDDRLLAKGGDDRLEGGDGRDLLDGGPGRDMLVGGAGPDRFVFAAGADRIADFRPGADRIDVSEAGFASFAAVRAAMTAAAGGTRIDARGDDSLFVADVAPGAFDRDDFIF